MSLTTIGGADMTVVVSSLGAEIQSIKDKNGVERLWQGDPAFWAGRAPVLFPMAGGLREDRYLLDGRSYPMPKHGYVRKLEWVLERSAPDSAVFLMTEQHPGFPFAYEYRVAFTVTGDRLEARHTVLNVGDRTFWYGMGAHEAYATPEGVEAYELVFDQPERFDCSLLEGSLLRHETVRLADVPTAVFPLRYEHFAQDALVFCALKSRGVTLRSRLHSRTVRVDYPRHDALLLWTKPGAGYICIEPWVNAPDYVDADMRIDHKPGCICLAPGQRETRFHTITVA